MVINRLFQRKREPDSRLPPGQYETKDFPVLSFGPSPNIDKINWVLEVSGSVENPTMWTWTQFMNLPKMDMISNIHCVTRWSKFDTRWRGVGLDYILEQVKPKSTAKYVLAHSYDGYSTNIPMQDLTDGQAMVAIEYESTDIPREHGGPARLFIPHLYFWKSAKWLKGLEFIESNEPGFWERRGYHIYGDPWKEQRFS